MKLAPYLLIALAATAPACSREEGADQSRQKEQVLRPCLNLNSARAEELIELPGIGHALARRIIEHRERYGPFRRTEEVIIVEGLSDRKYRAIASLVCVE